MNASEVTAYYKATPGHAAALFWELDAEQMADFFAELERLAGIDLCFQMAAAVNVIRKQSEAGSWDALNGFQTVLSHAENYAEAATEHRVWDAQRELRRMADAAKQATA